MATVTIQRAASARTQHSRATRAKDDARRGAAAGTQRRSHGINRACRELSYQATRARAKNCTLYRPDPGADLHAHAYRRRTGTCFTLELVGADATCLHVPARYTGTRTRLASRSYAYIIIIKNARTAARGIRTRPYIYA